mgnify:CR=1 FL=1
MDKAGFTRRETLKVLGLFGAGHLISAGSAWALPAVEFPVSQQPTDIRRQIFAKVWQTPLVDTHEHLPDEQDCLRGPGGKAQDDWTVILRTIWIRISYRPECRKTSMNNSSISRFRPWINGTCWRPIGRR